MSSTENSKNWSWLKWPRSLSEENTDRKFNVSPDGTTCNDIQRLWMPFSYLLLYEFVGSAQSTERETTNSRLPFLMSGTSTFTLLKVFNGTKWNVRPKRLFQ